MDFWLHAGLKPLLRVDTLPIGRHGLGTGGAPLAKMTKGETSMEHKPPSREFAAGLTFAVGAIAFAIAIFIIDTFTPLGLAVAVLYAVIVLMAGRFVQRRGLLVISFSCIAITALSFLFQHGFTHGPSLVRCLVSILAIAITTFLALKSQGAARTLREQASLLDLTHDSIFVRDMNDVITYWNHGAELLYGWPSKEAIGKVSHELLRTVCPAPLDEIKAALLATDRWEGELSHTKQDGTTVTVASRWSLQRDERGRPVATLETNNDITERKRAEAKVKQNEKELRFTIDTIPAFVFSNLTDGFTDFLNKRWLDYTGLSLTEAQGSGWQAAYHPEDLARVVKTRSENIAAGTPYEHEARISGADGAYRWFLNRSAPLLDERGSIVKWYGTNTDIEDRKQTEDALRRSEAYLSEAQKLSQTGSFGWDVPSGKIRWSDEAYRIFDYYRTIEPSIALVLERTHPDDRASLQRLLERVSSDRQNWSVEHRLMMPDGSVKHVHVVAHATSDTPDRLEYVGALMDMTAAKRAQEKLHQAQAELAHVTRVTTLGELTASIAHEVNQPLAAVITNGEACLRWLGNERPDLAEARGAVARIIRDGNRASEVIRRLRALTKKTDPHKTPLDINDVVYDVVALVQREVLSHRVRLRFDLDADLPPVFGDQVQLQQVIMNLMMNGIEAMAGVTERPRELLIRSRRHEGGHVLVAVQDSGIGIDSEHLDRLFTAFFTTKTDGMGMGLSICRSIVEAHGGEMWASLNDGPGATFQFTIQSHQGTAT
jgi:PAS domain S-box-containing protein